MFMGTRRMYCRLMQELDEAEYNHFFVKKVITRAMDKHNHEREMASILLSALDGEVSQLVFPSISYCIAL